MRLTSSNLIVLYILCFSKSVDRKRPLYLPIHSGHFHSNRHQQHRESRPFTISCFFVVGAAPFVMIIWLLSNSWHCLLTSWGSVEWSKGEAGYVPGELQISRRSPGIAPMRHRPGPASHKCAIVMCNCAIASCNCSVRLRCAIAL